MAVKTSSPTRGAAVELGNVICCGGADKQVSTETPLEIQAKFLRARFNLEPHSARLIAEIAFGHRRRA